MEKVQIVILAAGHGKRMQSDIPKVLQPLKGKTLIGHLLESVEASGVCETPVIVVGQKKEMVMKALGEKYIYVIQDEQLGTGHAVLSTEKILKDNADNILVLYGDQPYTSVETIKKMAETHLSEGNEMTMATVPLPDFNDWRKCFVGFSRVLRDESGKILRTVEVKDATDEQKNITEVNPCYLVFKAKWLWPNLHKIRNENNQSEYYLTDLIGAACSEGVKIGSVAIDPKEALGVNTRENLELLENL